MEPALSAPPNPPLLPEPSDHAIRVAVVERYSQWMLGSASWAIALVNAYRDPEPIVRYLDSEGA